MMDDLISRQAAIDEIRTMQTYKLFVGDDMLLVDQAETMTNLMMMPAAEPNYDGFLEFLFNVINPNEMEQYIAMYNSEKGVAEDG